MKSRFLHKLIIPAAIVGVMFAAPAALAQNRAIDILHFESLSFPGHLWTPFMPPPETGVPVEIFGILRLPAGVARVPAVVLTHGCSGIAAESSWGERLRQLGIATFLVNSFTPRGIPEVCSGRYAINTASVLTDMYRAASFMAVHPRIDATRIAVMGHSFGGRTALWAAHPRFQDRYGLGSLRLAAHVAFYPASCHVRLADEGLIGMAPIRIFHGGAEDLTPIAPCRDYVVRLRTAGKDAAIYEYPGAYHSFDYAALPPHQPLAGIINWSKCSFVERNGAIVDAATEEPAGIGSRCVGWGGTVGHHLDAHRKATDDLEEFFRALFRLS